MRVTIGAARRRKKNRLFKEARGRVGGRSKLLRTMKETIIRSRCYAYRDRRVRKRDFRRLWITRISAACLSRDIRYSQLIYGLKHAGIELNRKSLSELAIYAPEVFTEICGIAKEAALKAAA
ncbi:LSU ribosomal protein L20p [hydrothermal vent metagenome]|uniref:LSU ribosomal protein L20p n=1 Tax=hydrothermal vent metagenome TaxID=652676 RepID=A0A3B1DRG3_9ZZZZ